MLKKEKKVIKTKEIKLNIAATKKQSKKRKRETEKDNKRSKHTRA